MIFESIDNKYVPWKLKGGNLEINISKTVTDIQTESGNRVKTISKFKYLRYNIDQRSTHDQEINSRLSKALDAENALRSVTWNIHIRMELNLSFNSPHLYSESFAILNNSFSINKNLHVRIYKKLIKFQEENLLLNWDSNPDLQISSLVLYHWGPSSSPGSGSNCSLEIW